MFNRIFEVTQIFGVAALLLFTAEIAAACDLLADGGFEAGTPNPFWAETSTNFGTPLCDVASCGTLGSPRTGAWWAWFGGKADADESASLTQTVLIPADPLLQLNFYLWNPNTSDTGAGVDFLMATIDGGQVFRMTAGNPLYTGGYTLVNVDLSPYADGGCHTLSFQGTTFGSPLPTDIFVDDVAIQCAATVKIGATPYESGQAAVDAAANGSVVTASAYVVMENLLYSGSGTVTFKGGYNCAFTQNPGYTTINGDVTVSGAGTLILENVIVK